MAKNETRGNEKAKVTLLLALNGQGQENEAAKTLAAP